MNVVSADPLVEPRTTTRRQPQPISLVHHWMEYFRGGEAVLEQFGLLFPDAPISILVYNEQNLSPSLKRHVFHTSFLQKNRLLKQHFRKLLPLFPSIVPRLPIPQSSRFVLSTDASLVKGVKIPEGAKHACYCHSPPRYLWGMEDSYLESASQNHKLGRLMFSAAAAGLRRFDWKSAQNVDRFIANSRCVQERILRCYGRESVVIHPPVSLERFNPHREREDFYLIVSALVPYKFVSLAVEACTRLNRPLKVIGTGPEEHSLKRHAGRCIEFLGWASNATVKDHYERCRAFLFPGVEDFGITPCEAQAAGAPVIAFGEGGALETVRENVSGVFFKNQTVESLVAAIKRFEDMPAFDPATCRENVMHLGPDRFRSEMRDFLTSEFPETFEDYVWPENVETEAPVSDAYRESYAPVNRVVPAADVPRAEVTRRPLSVLEVVEPGNGGVFRHVEGLIELLLTEGVRVHLAYSDRRGSRSLVALAERVRRSGGEVINLRVINRPELRDIAALHRLRQFITTHQPDVIHGHSSKAGVLARVASKLGHSGAVFYTPHAYYGMSREQNRNRWFYSLVESALSNIGATINISRDEAAFGLKHIGLPPSRQFIVPNPVDCDRFQPPTAAERLAARTRLGLGPNDIAVGFVARMCWQKDPETAYQAMFKVAKAHPNVQFLHLGWGKWHDYLMGLVREEGLEGRFRIYDYQENPAEFYHGIDAFLITSRYEAGWPFVLLEALGCGLPVVTSACPGMEDVREAALSQLFPFEPENVSECASKLEACLESLGTTRKNNHREYALTHFSPRVCFGRVLELYGSKRQSAVTHRTHV